MIKVFEEFFIALWILDLDIRSCGIPVPLEEKKPDGRCLFLVMSLENIWFRFFFFFKVTRG